jgi:hypothetical protein
MARATNEECAAAARRAIMGHDATDEQYVEILGAPRLDKNGEAFDAISDLICNLHHLADQHGLEWEELLNRADFHYVNETPGGAA